MFDKILKQVKEKTPLVHNITNYVTVNDCANILLACGASPIMADDVMEVEEITAVSNALVINIGTLNERTIEAMIIAGKKANMLKHPVILDPVGAGASKFRSDTTFRLMREIQFTVIRGNISEIKTVFMGSGNTKGVDADNSEQVIEENLEETVEFIKKLSGRTGAVIAVTGAIDIVADSNIAYIIRNGHPVMSKISGTGCMLTSVIGAFCAANTDNILTATAMSVCAMGLCGEKAYEKMLNEDSGTSSFKNYLIDFMSKVDADMLKAGAKIERK